MDIRNILLTVQYITIGVLFTEILMVFLRWKNSIHSYLLLTCLTSFISNMGFLLQMKAGTEEAYLTALKFSYVGRVWIAFAIFLFSARMCRKKIPKWFICLLVLIHTGIFISIFTMEAGSLPKGTAFDLLAGMDTVYFAFAIFWVAGAFRSEKNRTSRSRYFMLIMAFGVQALSFILQRSGMIGISGYYDLTMFGALCGTVFMLIGIFRFDLLGTREIARDFVIDRISEGIIAVDNDGRVQYYNEPAARLYPEFDIFYGKADPGERGSGATPYDILSVITDAVRKGESLNIGDRTYTPEENDLQYRGESYGKLYALVDDTDHYRYMEELQKQRDIADNASEAKSRFLASMSHEIRTPINAVLGMDEMILRESKEKPIRAYAADIMSAGRTLLSLINDILDLSKVEEGKMEIIPVQYDLSSLINDLINMTRDRAVKKGLEFNVRVDRDIPHILYGDEIRVRQCAMNLLTNAVKYTEAGEVSLNITYKKKDEDHILLCFKISDTGIGMKEEDMEDLFSPYRRIEEKRNRNVEGTGLGMSITRQLLDLMGSSLKVESEYGKGSEFSFEVSQKVVKWEEIGDFASRFSDIDMPFREYHELFHAPDARILVVDDTEVNLEVVKSLLKKTEVKIDTALSGKEALVLSGEKNYDVIFIDHMMPDMDGIETLEHIRDSGMNKDVPAVALTANAVSGAREMYLGSGFTDCLFKPVDGERLERMLLTLLPEEKVLKAEERSDGSEPGHPEEDLSDIPERLKDLKEIDWEMGLKNCGSSDGYRSVLSVFHQTADSKSAEIEDFFRRGDTENYTTKVHALKSSARIIGATGLYELAKTLEEAGKRGDISYIEENTGKLIGLYHKVDMGLKFLDERSEALPEIGKGALREAYQTIIEIAGSMDYGLMEGLLKDLHGYSLPAIDSERLALMDRMLTELDWDGIIRTAEEAL